VIRMGVKAAAWALMLATLCGNAGAGKKPPRDSAIAADKVTYGAREDVRHFAADVSQRGGLDRSWVEQQLSSARKLPLVQRLVMPPPAGTAKNWAAYRARFVEPQRIAAGLRFWQKNEPWLALAEERFGVPAEIVVGIVGVETFYGRVMGDFRVIDALATLSFDFPTGRRDRSAYFRGELEELLVLAQREALEAATLRGSFAGAIGLPQFMPSSVNKYAVDFDGDGRIDLNTNAADVIGSVARYLSEFGWQRGMPTHYPVAVPVDAVDRAALLAPDVLPSFTAAQFAERGAELNPEGQAHVGPMALVELQNGDAAPSYVAGTQNFYAVTRYNWSSYYALAVIDLGAEVGRAWRRRP
jgi:membrane-bound lytic murein transglycosylase B